MKLISLIMSPSVNMFLLMYIGSIGVTMSLFVKYAFRCVDEKFSKYGFIHIHSFIHSFHPQSIVSGIESITLF